MLSVPNNYNSLLWLDAPALDELLKTVSPAANKTNTDSKKQSLTVSVYPLRYAIWTVEMLLKTLNFRFRHVLCGHCVIQSTLYNGHSEILPTVNGYWAIHCQHTTDITQYCPQNIRCILLNTTCRIFDGYCSILSTEHTMDIAQYCPQNV